MRRLEIDILPSSVQRGYWTNESNTVEQVFEVLRSESTGLVHFKTACFNGLPIIGSWIQRIHTIFCVWTWNVIATRLNVHTCRAVWSIAFAQAGAGMTKSLRRAFELVPRKKTAQQLRRSALFYQKVLGPEYKKGDCVLVHYPVSPPGCSPKISSHWRGPYRIIECLNDLDDKIEEISNGKQLVVHYDQLKRLYGVIAPPSVIPERNLIPNIFWLVNNVNYSITPIVSVWPFQRLPFSLLPPLPLCLFPVQSPSPRPYPLPGSDLYHWSFRQHLRAHCQDSFNASTLPACSSSSCGKTTLSGITPRESATPTSERGGIQCSELPPPQTSGLFAEEAPSFHTTSPNSKLEYVFAEPSRHL